MNNEGPYITMRDEPIDLKKVIQQLAVAKFETLKVYRDCYLRIDSPEQQAYLKTLEEQLLLGLGK